MLPVAHVVFLDDEDVRGGTSPSFAVKLYGGAGTGGDVGWVFRDGRGDELDGGGEAEHSREENQSHLGQLIFVGVY